MSRWYRAYEGTVTDAKLGEAALVADCSRSVAIAAWHCILESCASAQRGGEYETTPRRVAVILGVSLATIDALFAAFTEIGMIGNGAVTAWKQRQFESDTSTERSRKHRERKRNNDATLQQQDETSPQRDATPPETETDTETEREKEALSLKGDPEHWKVVQDLLKDYEAELTDWESDLLHAIKWKPTISKSQAENIKAIQSKVQSKSATPYALPSVRRGTPAYDAWIAYYRMKGPATFYEKLDVLTVPSEFPPQEKAA